MNKNQASTISRFKPPESSAAITATFLPQSTIQSLALTPPTTHLGTGLIIMTKFHHRLTEKQNWQFSCQLELHCLI